MAEYIRLRFLQLERSDSNKTVYRLLNGAEDWGSGDSFQALNLWVNETECKENASENDNARDNDNQARPVDAGDGNYHANKHEPCRND